MPDKRGRRRFLRRALITAAAIAAGVSGARLAHPLRRREIAVVLPRLPPQFDGLRIGVVADMHRSPVVSEATCRRAAALLADASCDLVANLGDNVSWSARYAPSALAGFAALDPPLGKFAVLGNHEYWTDAAQGKRALEAAGFRVLMNQHATVKRGGDVLHLVGIDDLWSGRPDFGAAFRGVPDDGCAIVLSHNPDAIYNPRVRRADLVLAGHTHGGQILGVGRMNAALAHCRYAFSHPHGLYREDRTQVYVTSGVGTGMLVFFRLGVPPEVAVITLRRAAPAKPPQRL